MRNKNKMILYAIIAILLFVIIWFACLGSDLIKQWTEGDDEEEEEEEEEEEPEPEEEEEEGLPHCSTVRYTKNVEGMTVTWTAVGLSENTYLEKQGSVAGPETWSAYWDWNFLGHISPDFGTRFLLYNHLKGLSSSDIGEMQLWWYGCMITTGYGGIF